MVPRIGADRGGSPNSSSCPRSALVSQSFLDVGVVHHLSSTAGAGHTVPANPMLQRINVLYLLFGQT
ncbi:hypothetical protein ACFX15_042001 [Malus domestica]